MVDSESPMLAILSGSRLLVWHLPFRSDESSSRDEEGIRSYDPYPKLDVDVPISSLAWNHNQMVIATSSGIPSDELEHDNIVLLSSQSGQKLDAFQHDSQWTRKQQQQHGGFVNTINFGGKSRYLCIGDESGAVCLWDLKKRIRVRQFFHTSDGAYPRPSIQVSLDPTDTYVMSLSPSAMYQYNLRDGKLVGSMEVPGGGENNTFTVFAISNLEPNMCAIGTSDGIVYIYDIQNCHNENQVLPYTKIVQRHNGIVTGLAFSPDNPNILFSSGTDGVVLAHNKSNGTSHKVCGAKDASDSIQAFTLHADGVTCAIGCASGNVYVFDIRYNIKGGDVSPILLASFQFQESIDQLVFAPPPRTKGLQMVKSGAESITSNHSEPTKQQLQPQSEPSTKSVKSPPSTPKADDKEKKKPNVSARSRVSPFATIGSRSPSNIKSPSISKKTEKLPLSPTSPTKGLSSPVTSRIRAIQQSPTTKRNMPEEVREVVREEIEDFKDHMEEQLRNLHIDMINQFHQQSQEIETVLSRHMAALERLTAENQQLREENEILRRGQQG